MKEKEVLAVSLDRAAQVLNQVLVSADGTMTLKEVAAKPQSITNIIADALGKNMLFWA